MPPSRRTWFAVPAIVAFLWTSLGSDAAWAYRFLRSFGDGSRIPQSGEARRWSDAAWGRGDTLVWYVLDSPLWEPLAREEVHSLVEDALETWARVPSADIRWRVDGVISGQQIRKDGRNTISLEELEHILGQARRWSQRRPEGGWELTECDVVFDPRYVEILASGNASRLSSLLHEFGHCIGLRHAAATPTIRWPWDWTQSSVWKQDPHMSYGANVDNVLTEDEVIGASLLRPASGWLPTTGNLSGRVFWDGDSPAPFVSVHVLRNEGGRARTAVQVFTNEEGAFLVEGLTPGDYMLWVHPMLRQDAHPELLPAGAIMDVRDLVLIRRHRVLASQETAVGDLAIHRGRDQR